MRIAERELAGRYFYMRSDSGRLRQNIDEHF
jgi:hypothetical protein